MKFSLTLEISKGEKMDGNFRALSRADILRRMTDRFAKLIQNTNAEMNEWRQAPEKSIAARSVMLELYKVTVEAVGQARLHGSPMQIEEREPTVADEVRVTFLGRVARFERDRGQNIVIARGDVRDTVDPTKLEDTTAWAEEVLSGIIVYLHKGQ